MASSFQHRGSARSLSAVEMDEDEDLQHALHLSKMQADAALRRCCTSRINSSVPAGFSLEVRKGAAAAPECNLAECTKKSPQLQQASNLTFEEWRLLPSVGTWLMPVSMQSSRNELNESPVAAAQVSDMDFGSPANVEIVLFESSPSPK